MTSTTLATPAPTALPTVELSVLISEKDELLKRIEARRDTPSTIDLRYKDIVELIKSMNDRISEQSYQINNNYEKANAFVKRILGIEEKVVCRRYRPKKAAEIQYMELIEQYEKRKAIVPLLSEPDNLSNMAQLRGEIEKSREECGKLKEELEKLKKEKESLYKDSVDALVEHGEELDSKIRLATVSAEERKKKQEELRKKAMIEALEEAAMSKLEEKLKSMELTLDEIKAKNMLAEEKSRNDEEFKEREMKKGDGGVYRKETPVDVEETKKLIQNHTCLAIITENVMLASSAYWVAHLNKADLIVDIATRHPELYEEKYINDLKQHTVATRFFVWSAEESRVIVLERTVDRLWFQSIYYEISTYQQARDNVSCIFNRTIPAVDLGKLKKSTVIC